VFLAGREERKDPPSGGCCEKGVKKPPDKRWQEKGIWKTSGLSPGSLFLYRENGNLSS